MEIDINETTLNRVRGHVRKYAEVISSVMKVEVEIVDSKMIRIAGTGIYKKAVGVPAKGSVYRDVLATGDSHIIKEPGKDALCMGCADKGSCLEKLEISTPIFYRGEIVGVIGLVCATESQKRRVLENLDSHLKFVKQISEFIAIKLYEYDENVISKERKDILNQILNSMDKGVIVVNAEDRIISINNSAMKELKLSPDYLNYEINLKTKEEHIYGKEIYEVVIDKKEYLLAGKLLAISSIAKESYRAFIFDSIKKLNAEYQQISSERAINIESIIGDSYPMERLKTKIKKVAPTKSTVLITGESGTGKELVARAIHAHSDRRDKPFIAINCAAIPDALLESELFGYVKGAFSGANPNGRMGKFELANGGVIFLDEIGDMPLYLQVKLLRVLQERKLVRIGSNKLMDLDIRVIAATNIDLKERIDKKKFREDLYYRLNVIPVEIPSLKEREGDILLIMDKLIDKYNEALNKYVHTVDGETKGLLLNYSWPGNVRELENTVEFMINLSDERGVITKEMLPDNILNEERSADRGDLENREGIQTIAQVEERLIIDSLNLCGRDTKGKNEAAKMLGIGIATLYRKIEKYRID